MSLRCQVEGSWFIQALCEVFIQCASEDSLDTLMNKVRMKLLVYSMFNRPRTLMPLCCHLGGKMVMKQWKCTAMFTAYLQDGQPSFDQRFP